MNAPPRDWQPLDTLPPDEQEPFIIAAWELEGTKEVGEVVREAGTFWTAYGNQRVYPTHWMPLPAGPGVAPQPELALLAPMTQERFSYLLREHNQTRALTTQEIAELLTMARWALRAAPVEAPQPRPGELYETVDAAYPTVAVVAAGPPDDFCSCGHRREGHHQWGRCHGERCKCTAFVLAEEPQAIDCPVCGKSVKQVASATLSLALWQHFNWLHTAILEKEK